VHWLVSEFLPQIEILRYAVAITHGGNNSVTEALAVGARLLVMPFSTDQFAGAAALEQAGRGTVLPPNTATVLQILATARALLPVTE
jgi:zeaxanthin glucosyltransferase